VAALTAAGCGSSGSTSSSTPSSTSSSNSNSAANSAQGSGGAGAKSVTNYLAYTGGKAGKADSSLPPVYIGWLNQQGGSQAIGPLATNGAQMAVNCINAELGGVDGHPLKLSTCFITSAEEEGTTCGQQFAANHKIDVIAEGGIAIGIQPFYSSIGTKTPVIAGVAVTPTDAVQPTR
jgi:branched-chain amino acid transport system substrate-binding protein